LILNRDFQHPADGWYDIEVPGEHPNGRAGIVQVIDNKAVESIVATFNREADQPNFAGMLIDIDHLKHDEEHDTRAYGWLMRLRNTAGRPQGQIRWTGTGQAAVDKGDFRFFSTEYKPAEMEVISNGKPKKLRPMRLDGLTLTNVPNNTGQRPITNRSQEFPPGTGAVAEDQKHNAVKPMKTVATKLGLSADAAEEAVLAEVTKIMNHADSAEAKIPVLTNRAETAETKLKQAEEAQVEVDLETYKDRYAPAQQPFIKKMLVTNRAEAVKFLQAQPVLNGRQVAPARVHVLNRAGDPNQAANGTESVDAENEELRQQRNEAIEAYRITNRCTHEVATDMVRNRKPELFGLPSRKTA